MSNVKWIKIKVNIFDDEKILLIESLPDADSIIVIWFKLLCLAGKQNNHGVFMLNDSIPYTDEMLATIFRRKVTTVKMALETFERFGMIARIDGAVTMHDRRDDIFTNSKVIAEGTGNEHESVIAIIQKYEKDIADFGRVEFSDLKSGNPRGGRPERICYLNEEQATFVITLLRNSKVVVRFKKELVRQFYAMRRFLIEKQSKLWNDTRIASKENRLKETDVIKLLAEYAKRQGSTRSDRLYMVYTRLAGSIVGGRRDNMSASELNTLTLIESIIKQTIEIDMSMGMHYKDIYRDCKERLAQFAEITYLTA